jgi:hypothetical protein
VLETAVTGAAPAAMAKPMISPNGDKGPWAHHPERRLTASTDGH